mgnify:CR=1 FL=1
MKIDLLTLKLFIRVVDEGTISRAAELENIAAAAVSRRLSELEDKLETLKLREKTVGRQEERIMKKLQEMQTSIQDAMQGPGQPGLGT